MRAYLVLVWGERSRQRHMSVGAVFRNTSNHLDTESLHTLKHFNLSRVQEAEFSVRKF